MENLSAFIMELTKLHNASKSERDEALEKVARSAGTLLRDLENLQNLERNKSQGGITMLKGPKPFAHMTAIMHARAKHKELVTCDQPPFCKGGEHCGRDKSGQWHCACLSQNKSER